MSSDHPEPQLINCSSFFDSTLNPKASHNQQQLGTQFYLDMQFSTLLRQLHPAALVEDTSFNTLLYQSLEVYLKSNFYCWKC